MKHTPGPWKVDQLATKNDQQAFINIGGFTRIDILPDSVGFPPETIALSERDSWFEIREQIGIDEANANAKLIASAPDLLWCLSEAVATWEKRHKDENHQIGITPEPFWLTEARLIIRKATE